MSQKKITNRLRSLTDIPGVNVRVKGNTVNLKQAHSHSLDFIFKWKPNPDRFVGYFVDDKGNESQAVIVLRNGLDAINFASAYSLLVTMRAKRRTR